MENAVKALSMAGSVLLSLLIIVLVIFYYDSLKFNEEMKRAKREEKEVDSINTQFETYLVKKYLIGSEVLSLANLAHNYNTPEYLDNGYNKIILEVHVNKDDSYGNSKLFETENFNGESKDLYDAYATDQEEVKKALNKQYDEDGDFKYGGHSFDFWLQWINAAYPEIDTNSKSCMDFVKNYAKVTNPSAVVTNDNVLEYYNSNEGAIKELWGMALEYAKRKNVIIDFSRLNFEVTKVEYDPLTSRIKHIVVNETN